MSSVMLAFNVLAAMWQHCGSTDNRMSRCSSHMMNRPTWLKKCRNVTNVSYSVQEEMISNCGLNLFWKNHAEESVHPCVWGWGCDCITFALHVFISFISWPISPNALQGHKQSWYGGCGHLLKLTVHSWEDKLLFFSPTLYNMAYWWRKLPT